MDIEARLEALELDQMERLTAEIAQDCVLIALIATHPNHAALRDTFQSVAEYRLTQLGDVGFDRGTPAKSAAGAAKRLREHLDAWSRKLP
ncbi:hypothetical protein [Xanthomonas sacchari]|uniref:hypothetical protein n=1 Tax=Xanthomonas sacchari TaxID=56458 RepID=UPI00224E6283|nr:hypothetical protein [Xanthomonas sacchari]MCW0370247.1 hypothetical protein [Xanthomonas sacchari]